MATYRSVDDRPIYSRWLSLFRQKLQGSLMQRGLRLNAQKRFLKVLDLLKKRQGVAPTTILLTVFLRLSPEVHLKGGKRRPYAAPVTERQRISLAVRWLLQPLGRNVSARRLTEAFEEALLNRGPAIATKKKIYRQAAACKHQKLPYNK